MDTIALALLAAMTSTPIGPMEPVEATVVVIEVPVEVIVEVPVVIEPVIEPEYTVTEPKTTYFLATDIELYTETCTIDLVFCGARGEPMWAQLDLLNITIQETPDENPILEMLSRSGSSFDNSQFAKLVKLNKTYEMTETTEIDGVITMNTGWIDMPGNTYASTPGYKKRLSITMEDDKTIGTFLIESVLTTFNAYDTNHPGTITTYKTVVLATDIRLT